MARVLPSCPARDHRAARSEARRLTEVGQLHQAYGESAKFPSLYSEAFPKENVSVFFRITKQHFTDDSVRDIAVPKVRRQTLAFLQCLVTRSGPRVGHLEGN